MPSDCQDAKIPIQVLKEVSTQSHFIFYISNLTITSLSDKYNGKDVRQAVYAGEHAKAKGGVGFNAATGKEAKNKDKLPKDFGNRPNTDGSTPLPGAGTTGLKEFPMMHNKKNGYDGRKPAPTAERIITKTNAAGKTELVGKVGHGATGDDHFGF